MKGTCQYCGIKMIAGRMARNTVGYYCKSELRCFNRLLVALATARSLITRMRHTGYQMSSACFNLSQQEGKVLTAEWCRHLSELRMAWDQAVRP